MLRYGFGADSENFGDFPIGLTPRDQRDAFDLTLGELRRGRDGGDRGARYLAGGFECETADKLDERQLLFLKVLPVAHGKRTGTVHLAGDVRRDRESISKACGASRCQYRVVPRVE